jgi:hypothetical protein
MDIRTIIYASDYADGKAECKSAVIVTYGRITPGLSIAEAREYSLELQRAADEAELKLKD